MKTVRFSNVIKACGKPGLHLLLSDPRKDTTLQKAIKQNRVLTVHQSFVGTKADYGTVGYSKGTAQILIFPRSLQFFAQTRVVGINLGAVKEEKGGIRIDSLKPSVKKSAKAWHAEPRLEITNDEKSEPGSRDKKIVHFPKLETDDDESEEVLLLRRQVKKAMEALDDGKQVAAYRILASIADPH